MKNYTDRSLTKGGIMSSTKYCQKEPQERPVYQKRVTEEDIKPALREKNFEHEKDF